MNELKPFYVKLLLFALVAGTAYYASTPVRPAILTHNWFPYILGMFALLTALFHAGLVNAGKKNNQAFVRYYMGATTGKLLFYMMIIVFYALLIDVNTRSFIILFFLLYLLFTAFEVSYAYKKLSAMKTKSDKDNQIP
jgi:hypothetical protein